MKKGSGYFDTGNKISKITEDGLRINHYPSGVVTTQLPGQSHSTYKSGLNKDFSSKTPSQMSDYAFGLFKK